MNGPHMHAPHDWQPTGFPIGTWVVVHDLPPAAPQSDVGPEPDVMLRPTPP
jgi:hypothetical protein